MGAAARNIFRPPQVNCENSDFIITIFKASALVMAEYGSKLQQHDKIVEKFWVIFK